MDYPNSAKELFDRLTTIINPRFRRDIIDVSCGEMGVLGYLVHKRNGVFAGELSENLDLSTPRVAAALKSLVRKGFINRVTDENDRRKATIFITYDGKKEFILKQNEAISILSEMLFSLGEEDSAELLRIIKKIADLKIV